MQVNGVGVGDYLALKQLNTQVQVSTKVLRTANDTAKQQAEQLIDVLTQGIKGGRINIKA